MPSEVPRGNLGIRRVHPRIAPQLTHGHSRRATLQCGRAATNVPLCAVPERACPRDPAVTDASSVIVTAWLGRAAEAPGVDRPMSSLSDGVRLAQRSVHRLPSY